MVDFYVYFTTMEKNGMGVDNSSAKGICILILRTYKCVISHSRRNFEKTIKLNILR